MTRAEIEDALHAAERRYDAALDRLNEAEIEADRAREEMRRLEAMLDQLPLTR